MRRGVRLGEVRVRDDAPRLALKPVMRVTVKQAEGQEEDEEK